MAQPALRTLERKHSGRRGFVLGTGMSVSIVVNELQVSPHNLDGEITIGCKQAYKKFNLRYLVSMDETFFLKDRSPLLSREFIKFIPSSCGADSLNAEFCDDSTVILLQRSADKRPADSIPAGFADLCIDSDTGVVALRIAFLLGLNPIYLLGLHDPIYKGRLHFHDESKRPTAESEVLSMGEEMVPFVKALVARGIEVISCSPISRLNGVIPYVEIASLFPNAIVGAP
jgi:hypothetical protein